MGAISEGRSKRTDWLGLFSIGFFIILLGAIWVMTPATLTDEVTSIFKSTSWHLKPLTGNISLPEPTRPFPTIYTAASQFCFIFGFFQTVILILRFALHDPLDKKADAASGMGFWLIAGYFLYLLSSQSISWFAFLAGIIVAIGVAIIASSIVRFFRNSPYFR
jgi:hypothetical protein